MSSAEQLSAIVDADVDSFSMLVRDNDQSILRYIDQASYPWIDDMKSSDKPYRRKVVRVTTPFTILPASEFNTSVIERVARQAFPLEPIDHVYHFIHEGIAAVYVISSELKSRILQQFPNYSIEHIFESLLKLRTHQDSSILAHWTNDGILLVAFHGGLRIANYYNISTPEDAIFYILSAYKYADLDPLIQPLGMSGRISKDGILFNKVSGFVRDFVWLNHNFEVPEDFPFDQHVFYHLM